jgi:hypothetical protein
MELSEIGPAGSWAPQACTLPSPQRPQRQAEFDALFTADVRGIERAAATRLRLDLQASPPTAARAAELAVAETGCCSFFTFALTASAGRLILEITVPPSQVGVLDALASHVAEVRSASS